MKASLLFPLFLIFAIVACKKPTEALNNSATTWREYENPMISPALLKDTLPARFISSLPIKEVHGIKAQYESGKCTSYFEYEVDSGKLLAIISTLPFKRGNTISDTTCRSIDLPFFLSGKTILSKEEIAVSSFFWEINPGDYEYYECLKNPTRHTILINKKSGRVLHRIELMG